MLGVHNTVLVILSVTYVTVNNFLKINFLAHHFSIGFLNPMTFKVSIIAIIPLTLLHYSFSLLSAELFTSVFSRWLVFIFCHNNHNNAIYILSQVIPWSRKINKWLLHCNYSVSNCAGPSQKIYQHYMYFFLSMSNVVSLGSSMGECSSN